mgnify:CR=1 FL=1
MLDIEKDIKEYLDKVDDTTYFNSQKVLNAFIKEEVSENDFNITTGYGYADNGRDKIERIYADIFKCEDALVRNQFISGSHALTVCLFALLRPNDILLSISGKPYDTLEEVIGIRESKGSLKEYGITYAQVDLLEDGSFDFEGIKDAINDKTKLIHIQRSKGYATRPTLSVDVIGEAIAFVKEINKDLIVMVDNCYGEFVDVKEPTEVGADLIVGSLIKNPGGGIARTGGYIAGNKDLVELCSYRLTCVGMGKEVGCTLSQNREMFLGFFMSPEIVANAVKTADFAASIFSLLGFESFPLKSEKRSDIITAVKLGNPELLKAFCRGIQKGSPVDSFVTPEAWDMPGYESQVIMAAGAFTMGASIELSADAPIRDPYAVWMQGGITYSSGKTGVMLAVQEMVNDGLIKI